MTAQHAPGTALPVSDVDADWWRHAVVYQIYPRSFADSNGDGVGDVKGITSRVPYLTSLGVDAVWLSPFYPSALADGGYDVDDYRNVDPRLGSLDDFDAMVAALHDAGMKVIVDIVPNHSSDRHVWFREALAAGPGSPARDRYIFRDGKGPDGAEPPSDWQSVFGGPAWTRVPDGQWYLHLFAPEQPDFNWDHPEVREDFLTTLRFWSDRGVDGFRVDVAHGLVKNLVEPFPPQADLAERRLPDGTHPLWDRDEVHDIYAEWRKVFNEYDPPRTAVAEAWVHPSRRTRYARPDGLGQAFNFDLLRADWDAAQFRAVIDDNLAEAGRSGASSTWVLSNHDVVRHASRYGLPQPTQGGDTAGTDTAGSGTANQQDGKAWVTSNGTTPALDRELGIRRARAATLLKLALPGSAYLYQGEELALHEVADLPVAALQDPMYQRSGGREKGRDGCRVPLPWRSTGPSFGFGDGPAHLPQPEWFGGFSVETEESDPESTLQLYRRALAWRRKLRPTGPAAEEFEWVEISTEAGTGTGTATGGGTVLCLARPGGWRSVTNFGPESVALPSGSVVLTSGPLDGDRLPTDTTAWILTGDDAGTGRR